jgi:hypothetical protein
MLTRRTVLGSAAALPLVPLPTFANPTTHLARFINDAQIRPRDLYRALLGRTAWNRIAENNNWRRVPYATTSGLTTPATAAASARHWFLTLIMDSEGSFEEAMGIVYKVHTEAVA